MAWRGSLEPAVSRVMDSGPASQRRETNRKRVLSPRAANSGAEFFGSAMALALRRLDKVRLDQLHHHAPTLLVCRERLRPARERDSIEAGLSDRQDDAVRRLLQGEDH